MCAARRGDFDVPALYAALDAQRTARGLSWPKVANEIWELSADLNERRHDHPISPSTLTGMATRRAISCQHALFMLRWLGRAPESFLTGSPEVSGAPLPATGTDKRLRWNLRRLADALDEQRAARQLTWAEVAAELGCTPSQASGVRTAKFAIGMVLAMRIVRWLDRPAADFVYAASW